MTGRTPGSFFFSFGDGPVSQLGAEFADAVAKGSSKRAGGDPEFLPNLGILKSGCHGLGNLVPGAGESRQGLFDLGFARAVIVGHPPVRVSEPVLEVTELGGDSIPWVGPWVVARPGPGRRIFLVRLHLLDGTYELFRAHFGRRDEVPGPDGRDIHATLGIIESTLALLREPGVTHLAASFDTVIESFRNEMFDGYKTSAGIDEDLLGQFPLAERALEAIGVVVWRNIEFEADDALAAAAVRWVEDVEQVVIVSPDKDMTQVVVGDRIVTYNRREQKLLDEKGVVDKFGVHPESIPDYLALVGDTADGVPGLPGWGAKSSSTVLARYPRLELIPEDPDDWEVEVRGAKKLAATLLERREEALLYRELTTLRLDVPIGETLDELEWQGVPEGIFREFCSGMGFEADQIRVDRWSA